MKTPAQSKTEAAEAILSQDHSQPLLEAEIVKAVSRAQPPTSVRLSAPLLEALDRLAIAQHRTRGNLIQHILWEYVHQQDAGSSS